MEELPGKGVVLVFFDGICLPECATQAKVVHPSLSSVTHPPFETGETVAKLFFRTPESEQNPEQAELNTRMLIREGLN